MITEEKTLNIQGTKWQVTINGVDKLGITLKVLIKILNQFTNIKYCCLCFEETKKSMKHVHIFILFESNMRFSTLKNKFPQGAHFERCNGSVAQNRDYILKGGKWIGSEKEETSLKDTFWEYPSFESLDLSTPAEARNQKVLTLLDQDCSNYEIMHIVDGTWKFTNQINAARQEIVAQEFMNKYRDVNVTYLYGKTGTGKTYSIFKKHGPQNICRITTYRDGKKVYFDDYHNEDVIVFEEFNSQIQIQEMLNLLDKYPLRLPARYADKVACYTQVYITSNKPLEEQYIEVQKESSKTYDAFLRRINNIVEFTDRGEFDVIKGTFQLECDKEK